MTTREDIAQALYAATPGPWERLTVGHRDTSDIVAKVAMSVGGSEMRTTDATWVMTPGDEGLPVAFVGNGPRQTETGHLIANAPQWLRWQQERIAQLARELAMTARLFHLAKHEGPPKACTIDRCRNNRAALAALEDRMSDPKHMRQSTNGCVTCELRWDQHVTVAPSDVADAAVMTDEDTLRARHTKHDDWYCEAGDRIPPGQDQCDTALALALVNEARAERDALVERLPDAIRSMQGYSQSMGIDQDDTVSSGMVMDEEGRWVQKGPAVAAILAALDKCDNCPHDRHGGWCPARVNAPDGTDPCSCRRRSGHMTDAS